MKSWITGLLVLSVMQGALAQTTRYGVQYGADPELRRLNPILEHGEEIAKGLADANRIIDAQVEVVESLAGDNAKYNLSDADSFKVQKALKSVEKIFLNLGWPTEKIANVFQEVSVHHPTSDQAASINVAIEGIGRDARFLIGEVVENSKAERVLGGLKAIRFQIGNVAGNMLFTVENAAGDIGNLQLSKVESVKVVQKISDSLVRTFESVRNRLASAKPGLGARAISYVIGNTIGDISEPGPSNLDPKKALQVENTLMSELSTQVAKSTESGTLSGWLKMNRIKGRR